MEVMLILTMAKPGRSTLLKVKRVLICIHQCVFPWLNSVPNVALFLCIHTGTNLFQVATHEFGHSLGLEHTHVTTAVMYPFYGYSSDFKLDKDDIEGIQVHWTNILKFNRYIKWFNSLFSLNDLFKNEFYRNCTGRISSAGNWRLN
jgi:hypothetical protein